jgi:hypothetical protein
MRRSFASPLLLAVLGLSLGACKVDKINEDEAKTGEQAKAEEPEAEDPKQDPREPPARPGATGDLGKLFRGAKPGIPEAIAKLHARQSRTEVQKLLPELHGTDQGRVAALDDPSGFTYALRFDEAGGQAWLISVSVELDRSEAVERGKAAWGEPKTATDGHGETSFFWFNPEAKVRASLTPTNAGTVKLAFMPYESTAGLLGQLGFGAGELLGLSRTELEAKHGDRLRRIVEPKPPSWTAQLWYPASTWNPQPSLVQLHSDESGERVAKVVVELPFLHLPKLRDALFAELVEVFGEPQSGDAESGARFQTSDSVAIDARLERGRWILEATAAAKQ